MAKMTVAEAAEMWVAEKKEEAKRKPRLEAAAEVLKAHFRKTDRTEYKGQIRYEASSTQRLDTEKVKNELYDRLEEFMRPVPYERLTLIRR